MAVQREVRRTASIASSGVKRPNRRHTWSSEEFNAELSFEDDKIKALADEHESVQKKTFTNWVNVHLSRHGNGAHDPVKNLYTDFQNGRLLFLLIENLSGDNLGKLSRGKMRFHNLENVEKCLNYLRKHEVQLENVHAHDVVDGNPKIVLGLIWKLILKYQLTDIRSHLAEGAGMVGGVKASLLLWCQRMTQGCEGVNVTNFTSSWKDGKAFAALLHRHRPDLLDYRRLLQGSPVQVLETVFAVTEKALGVPRLIEPSDVASYPEEKSVMTYVGALFQTFSRMKVSNTVTVRLTKILQKLEDRDRLTNDFEDDAKRLLQWTSSRMNWLANDRDVPTMEAKSCRTELKLIDGLWQKEKREKLLEWNQMILTCHTLCCTLQGIPARMGETLQSVQEAWLKLEAGENMRKSLLIKRISSAESANTQNRKIGKRVERLLQKMHTLSQLVEQVDSAASLDLAQEQLERVITGLKRCTVYVDAAQQRCPLNDFTPYKERLSQLEVECGQIQPVLTHKAGFYSNRTASKLLIQASALTDFLNEVKVSATSQNSSLKLHSAHSSFQKERCHQLAVEVAAYLPHVKRVVMAMKLVCPPASAHSPLRVTLTEKAEGLLRAYNSLKRLGAEMAAAGKRREQREFQELREIEKREREECCKRREEKKAVREERDRAMEEIVVSESEEETTFASEFQDDASKTEPVTLTNDIHDPRLTEDIHEDLEGALGSILEKAEVIGQYTNRENASVVTPPVPNEGMLPIGGHLSNVESTIPSSNSEPKMDQFRFESNDESGNIPEYAEEDEVVVIKENGRLPESITVETFQRVENESPSLAAGDGDQDKGHTPALPLVASMDERLVSILAQVEAEWVSNCKSILRDLKKERKLLEVSGDADDIGRTVFGLLQRLQFLVVEGSVHLARTAALQSRIHSCSQWQSSCGLQEVELVKEAILELSQSMNAEVAVLLRLLDHQEGILKCDYALSWFSEKDYMISDLDPPAGSPDISYQIQYIRNILMEAKVVYNSIEPVERAGPETNMADSAVESKTLLPADKLHNLQHVFEALNERAQGRLALLEETLRATAFSEWADIFSIWLAEKNNALSRYTKPSSVDKAECFVVYFHRCHDSTLKVCRAAVNEWEDHVAAMATDCPTFSRGVQHIFAALKEDCDGYEERLRHLEESQNVQLQIRFHLFKIDGLVAQIANLIKTDTPNRILPPSEIERRDTALTREVKILESLVFSARDRGKELIEGTPPSEIGRKILATEQDTLMSTWGQYHKGRLHLRQQLADMRVVSDLCCEADHLIGQVEGLKVELQTPLDMSSKDNARRALVLHSELATELVSLAGEMGVFLHGALAVIGALGENEVVVREVFERVTRMKAAWSPVPQLWEETQSKLVDAYQLAVAMAPIEDSEDWLSRMDGLLTSAHSKEEGEGEEWGEEEVKAVLEVEVELVQREEQFRKLEGEQDTPSEEIGHLLTTTLLNRIPDLDFDAVLHVQEPRAPIALDNGPPKEVGAKVVMEVAGAQVKGILKPSRYHGEEEWQVTMATELVNGPRSRGFGAASRKDNRIQVVEEECLAIVQTDLEYSLDWASVFGQSLFRDSPRNSPFPFRRSRSYSPTRPSASLPVIERSHILLQQDRENDFFTRVEALQCQVQRKPESEAKRQVSFRKQVSVFEYTPDVSLDEESDEVSIDSFEDSPPTTSTVEKGPSSHAVVEDVRAATQETELHSEEVQRKKQRREKVGSMWAWVNQRKGVADKSDSVEFVKATPLLDSPVVWDHRGEIPVDSSDGGEENALYNVSSLTSIIDRYEGKVMRKHEMENWSKKAMKRFRVSWKQFHAVAYLGQLSFYKDAKHALMGMSISRGFYLRGAKCEVATDYQKKPHVFRLTLSSGAAYLFQANNETEVQEWIQNIQSQIQQESSTVGVGMGNSLPLAHPAPLPPPVASKGSAGQRTVASRLV